MAIQRNSGKANGSHGDESDAGDGVISRYDPRQFVVPAQDHQGHSEREWCRVQPTVDREIDSVVRSRKFPFKTKGDVIRWCIKHGLKQLAKMEAMPGFVGRAAIINDLVREEIYFAEFNQMFDNLDKVVTMHVSSGSQNDAARLLVEAKGQINLIEEPTWRKKAQEKFDARFGHVMNIGGKGKAATISAGTVGTLGKDSK